MDLNLAATTLPVPQQGVLTHARFYHAFRSLLVNA